MLVLRRLAVTLALLLSAALPRAAEAADIRVLQLKTFDEKNNGSIDVDEGLGFNMGPEGDIVCNIMLEGEIEGGDLDQLKQIVEQQRIDDLSNVPRLCLNSPGGAYDEGVKLANYLIEKSIGTAIMSGAQCYSACSLVFMGGTFPWKGQINRFLHVNGLLGFHAPFIPNGDPNAPKVKVDEAVARKAYGQGVAAIQALMNLGVGNAVKRVAPELVQQMLSQGPDEFFYVDTLGRAINYRIALFGIAKVPAVDDGGICNACLNMNYFANEMYGRGGEHDICTTLGPARRKAYAKGVRVTNDVAARMGECSVDLKMEGRKLKSWFFVSGSDQFGEGLELAYWYLYPPNAKLASLGGAPPGPAAAAGGKQAELNKPGRTQDDGGAADALTREIADFAVNVYLGDGKPNYDSGPEIYGNRVAYFDEGEIARDKVMADKARYNKRWPQRRYDYIADSLTNAPGPNGAHDVTLRYSFEVGNGRETRRGTGVARIGIARSGDRFVIVREGGEVDKK